MQSKVTIRTHPPSSKPGLSHARMATVRQDGSLRRSGCIKILRLTHQIRAILKKDLPENNFAAENLERECQSYRIPGVASATCFRQLYDVIDNHTIALEWLDSTLADMKFQPNTRTYVITKVVLKETLTSCVILDRQKYVDTGKLSSTQ